MIMVKNSSSTLKQHCATIVHYSCDMTECSGLTFCTSEELNEHHKNHHQFPAQQLAQKVQKISKNPATFSSQSSYRPSTAPPARYGNMPQTIGKGVVLSPICPSQSVPNLPPGIQLSKRPATQSVDVPAMKKRREESSQSSQLRLPDSITLVSRTPSQPSTQQRQRDKVKYMLANRSISVVPSVRTPPSAQGQSVLTRQLNAAISITPLSSSSSQASRSVCQICDKAFATPGELSQHMACHRGGYTNKKLAFECQECTAQYPTEDNLQAHRQKYHGAGGPSPDMAIPVVDLKQVGVLSRLAALGIRSIIPLSQLQIGAGGGMFGLPVVAVNSASNPVICNIGGMSPSNLLPFGPLKNITFNNMR